MVTNKIIVQIVPDDRLSPKLRDIGGQATQMGGQFNGLGSIIRNNVLSANLLSSAIVTGMGAAQNAVSSLTSFVGGQFSEAMEASNDLISVAGDLGKLTGLSFEESTAFMSEFSAELAAAAATLPGATADFVSLARGISDNLVPAFQDLNGNLDQEGFRAMLGDISTFAGVRTATSGRLTNRDASLGISRALGGSSLAELSRLQFFQENPAVLATVEKQLAEMGADGFAAIAPEMRAAVLREALEVEDEVIQKYRESWGGILEGFRSSLFDPYKGAFSFLKDLRPDLEGDQSILTEATETLGLIVGDDGILAGISKSLGVAHLEPMEPVLGAIERVNGWLGRFDRLLDENGTDGAEDRSLLQIIGSETDRLWDGLIDWVGNSLNSVADFFRNNQTGDVFAFGDVLGQAVGNWLGGVAVAISSISYGDAIEILFDGLTWSFGFLTGLIRGFDWDGLAKLLWRNISETFSTLASFVWQGLSPARDAISDLGKAITNALRSLANILPGGNIPAPAPALPRGGQQIYNSPVQIPSAAEGFFPSTLIGSIVRSASQEMREMPSGAKLTIANTSEAILNRDQQSNLVSSMNQAMAPATRATGTTGGDSQVTLTFGDIHINAGSGDPQKIATIAVPMLLKEIESGFRQYEQNRLAPSF
ncbi:hypothetical protein IQ268_28165 [Oculatella sp. LEGE 06141]|uniref:hypothetical protein n=1 Tax=Oculatella sp. LEGE 06141 TaxID=1828648 RepID=UPI00187EB0C3|nr:hypothetical protein [Oculatella sp. LEGE 06141]MBE9182428.1 hypothetical protein [Oculatella sp. LEGE 06141]